MVSIGEIRKTGQTKYMGKKHQVIRFFSAFFTKGFLWLGLSANAVSALGILTFIFGIGWLFVCPQYPIVSPVLLALAFLFDYCDGEVARIKKTFTHMGVFWEARSNDLTRAVLGIALGVYGYYFIENDPMLLFMGALFSLSSIYAITFGYGMEYYFRERGREKEYKEGISDSKWYNKAIDSYASVFNFAYTSPFLALTFIANFFSSSNLFPVYLYFYGISSFVIMAAKFVRSVYMFRTLDRIDRDKSTPKWKS